MKLKPLKKLTGLDYVTGKLFGFVDEFLTQLMPNQFLYGVELSVDVSTTATAFNHTLGVTPQGWIILDIAANITVWRTGWTDKTITLDASGSGTIKIWVF